MIKINFDFILKRKSSTKLTDQGCDGAPDWIIKIVSPGNPENDYIKKLNLYKNAGVRKYWIVDPMCKRVIVYQLAESRIYRYCYYKLKQREMAEDITQETFLRFFGKKEYQEGEHPLKVLLNILRAF